VVALAVLVGCGERMPFGEQAQAECSAPPEPQVWAPSGLLESYRNMALDDAQDEFTDFIGILHGNAFRGTLVRSMDGARFVDDNVSAIRTLRDGFGRPGVAFTIETEHRRLALTFTEQGVQFDGIPCQEVAPPEAGLPYELGHLECFSGDLQMALSFDFEPVEERATSFDQWQELGRRSFVLSGDEEVALHQRTYSERVADSVSLHVDYEAVWAGRRQCPERSYLEEVTVLNVERCNYAGHTHGRHDAACSEIGSFDGRPSWARP